MGLGEGFLFFGYPPPPLGMMLGRIGDRFRWGVWGGEGGSPIY